MSFNPVFGGNAVYPDAPTYLALVVSQNITLEWPIENSIGGNNVVASIIDAIVTSPGLTISLSDATQVANGYTTLFNNLGGDSISILDSQGGVIVVIPSGSVWEIYLINNQTPAGLWRSFQYGAATSVANAGSLAGPGLAVQNTFLAQNMFVSPKSTSYSIQPSDRASVLVWISGTGTFNLPSAATVGNGWFVNIRNSGSGDLSVTPPAGTIDGGSTKVFPAGGSGIIVSDGANYFTIGFGTAAGTSGFDFISINVAGSGDFVLSGAQLNRISYRFTGVLTGTRNIVVPGSIQQYWIDNQTTGAFNLFVKTSAQTPGIQVLQSNTAILYCDGTNVINAESATVSFPIPIVQGGTGAITAAAARTNLSPFDLATQVSGNLGVANLNSGTGASGTTFWAGDATWKGTPNITGKTGVTKTLSTSAPSGGSDGDIWYRF